MFGTELLINIKNIMKRLTIKIEIDYVDQWNIFQSGKDIQNEIANFKAEFKRSLVRDGYAEFKDITVDCNVEEIKQPAE